MPLVHNVAELYKKIYRYRARVSKRDQFGIYLKIDHLCLHILEYTLSASFAQRTDKIIPLREARTYIEVLKRLVRISSDLDILPLVVVLDLQTELQEISKMTNGWIKYLQP